jgi:hypothetical protein
VKVLQSHVNVLKGEPVSSDEACVTSSDDGGQVIDIKVEEDSDVQEGECPELVMCPLTEAEHEVCHMTYSRLMVIRCIIDAHN